MKDLLGMDTKENISPTRETEDQIPGFFMCNLHVLNQ